MPNVSQRDSTAIPTGGEVSARHTNHLRSSACRLSSFLDRRIRHHQVLAKLPGHREETAMIKIIKARKLWSTTFLRLNLVAWRSRVNGFDHKNRDGSRTRRDNESLAFSCSLIAIGKLRRIWFGYRKEVLVLAISMIIYLFVYFSI
jgi:hypothetical protein